MIFTAIISRHRSIFTYTLFCLAAIFLAGCASPQEKALGQVARAGNASGPTVYVGNINRKYRVIGKVSEKRRQIAGPNYYDSFSGTAWVAAKAKDLGADAVINYGNRRIAGKIFLLDPGHFEAWGTAVKFVN